MFSFKETIINLQHIATGEAFELAQACGYDKRSEESCISFLARKLTKLYELEQEAGKTLDMYRELGRVVVANDGNVVQRLAASAEIAIANANQD